MMAHSSHAVASSLLRQAVLQQSGERLARSLELIAARHRDEAEVVAVCEKWALRLLELKRQTVTPDVDD